MPIIDFQRRMRQLGEIRLGHVVDTGRVSEKTGKPILRPAKLDKFRFTSASRPLLEQIAQLYGGTVQEWTPANGGPKEWEVYSEVDRVPVIVPPMNNVIDSWFEQYKGSKCARRCDGQVEQKSDQPCICRARWGDNWREAAPVKERCQITTRLNVMLRDVRGLGVWLLTTHGFYATSELPAMAETLLRARGEIPGFLTMEEKVVPLEDGVARFMVPKLDVNLTPGELFSGAAPTAAVNDAGSPAVEGEHQALSAGQPTAEHFIQVARECPDLEHLTAALSTAQQAGFAKGDDEVWRAFVAARERLTKSADTVLAKPSTAEEFMEAAEQAASKDELTEVLKAAQAVGFATNLGDGSDEVAQVFKARLRTLEGTTEPAPSAGSSPDRDVVWSEIVAAWPGDKVSEIEDAFAQHNNGATVADASGEDLAKFLVLVKNGAIKPATTSSVPF